MQTDSYTKRFGQAPRDTFDIVPDFAPTYLCDFARCESLIRRDLHCVLLPNALSTFAIPTLSRAGAWIVALAA